MGFQGTLSMTISTQMVRELTPMDFSGHCMKAQASDGPPGQILEKYTC